MKVLVGLLPPLHIKNIYSKVFVIQNVILRLSKINCENNNK